MLCVALTVYTIILFVKVIVSWLPLMGVRMPYSGPARKGLDLLDDVTEPALAAVAQPHATRADRGSGA